MTSLAKLLALFLGMLAFIGIYRLFEEDRCQVAQRDFDIVYQRIRDHGAREDLLVQLERQKTRIQKECD